MLQARIQLFSQTIEPSLSGYASPVTESVPVRGAASGVSPVIAVARGEGVTIAIEGEGFAVSQPGEALEPGAVGDWIRVRTVKDGSPKGEPMRAKVQRPGLVSLPLP